MEKYQTIEQVHNRACDAVGKTFSELNGNQPLIGKSGPGDAFEAWFGKPKDSLSEPDLRAAGVELKATPIRQLKNGQFSAKERLVLSLINYDKLAQESFATSHFLHKNKTIELAFYEPLKSIPKDQWTFKDVALYEMQNNPQDFKIIKQDWQTIQRYVRDGRAHELNEGLTEYLAPCTKGANSKSVRKQPFSDIPAKQRAFSLKTGYMTALLRKYIFGNTPTESIFQGKFDARKSLDEAILGRLNKWRGKTVQQLQKQFSVDSKSKSLNYQLAARMLELTSAVKTSTDLGRVEELEKANIVVKTVSFNQRGSNLQSMSFPGFKFQDLAHQSWNDQDGMPSADWHKFLLETKFLLVVFQTIDHQEVFMGAKFFRIPDQDIEGPIRDVWEDTVRKICLGVQLEAVPDKNSRTGYRVSNNFITRKDDMICHVRPHTSQSDYSANGAYSDQLPNPIKWHHRPQNHALFSDDWMTAQCFWLNNSYIKKQVQDMLH